jgi:RNA-binding protein YhbY
MRPEGDRNRIAQAWQEPAMIQIGKGGISDTLVKETVRLLKKHHYIKVRMLKSALEGTSKLELMTNLCESSGSILAGVRGNTAVIHRTRASQRTR